LPLDHRGFPVPWFVAITDGVPDFRVIRPSGLRIAVAARTCWICGHKLGRHMAFVIGPMCAVNRINSEPPSHRECAEFAVRACPFMIRPRMKRNTVDLPKFYIEPAGVHLDRNPGVMCMWICNRFTMFRVSNGVLLELGEPSSVSWWAEGREATAAEVKAALDSGLPTLQAMAESEGAESLAAMAANIARLQPLLPNGGASCPSSA
jgi:hypothetical protein